MARRPPPIGAGLKGQCPECGKGRLFAGFLTFAKGCNICGADLRDDDAGDGPAIFVIFIVGIFIIPMALAFQMITNAPMWVTMSIWIPVIIIVCLLLLRLLRGVMFNIAWATKAREIRNNQIRQSQTPEAKTPPTQDKTK